MKGVFRLYNLVQEDFDSIFESAWVGRDMTTLLLISREEDCFLHCRAAFLSSRMTSRSPRTSNGQEVHHEPLCVPLCSRWL